MKSYYLGLLFVIILLVGCTPEQQISDYAKEYNIKEGASSNYFSNLGVKWIFDKNGPNLPKYKIDLYVTKVNTKPTVIAVPLNQEIISDKVVNGEVKERYYVPLYSNYRSADSYTFEQAVYKFNEMKLTGKEVFIIASLDGSSLIGKNVNELQNDPNNIIKKVKLPEVDKSLVIKDINDVDIGWCNTEVKEIEILGNQPKCESYLNELRDKLNPEKECIQRCTKNPHLCKQECCSALLQQNEENPSITNYQIYLVMYYNWKNNIDEALICNQDFYNQLKKERGW